jgi:hypothetical protein
METPIEILAGGFETLIDILTGCRAAAAGNPSLRIVRDLRWETGSLWPSLLQPLLFFSPFSSLAISVLQSLFYSDPRFSLALALLQSFLFFSRYYALVSGRYCASVSALLQPFSLSSRFLVQPLPSTRGTVRIATFELDSFSAASNFMHEDYMVG